MPKNPEEVLAELWAKAAEQTENLEPAAALMLYTDLQKALAQKEVAQNLTDLCQHLNSTLAQLGAALGQLNLQELQEQLKKNQAR